MPWDPGTYLAHADHRGRPFHELLARVGAENPARVADLGCGAGNLTATLAERWRDAQVVGVDSSAEMLATARTYASERVSFEPADIADWRPTEPYDVVVTNAALQWLPDQREAVRRVVEGTAVGGWLAIQVPGNWGEPCHRLLYSLAEGPRWGDRLGGLRRLTELEPEPLLDLLSGMACDADVWETTYLHRLPGDDAVLGWMRGTALVPYVAALEDDPVACQAFLGEYADALREAYPRQTYGTVLPFRRVFAVARRAAGAAA